MSPHLVEGRWDRMELLEEGKPMNGSVNGLMIVHLSERLRIELHKENSE